ncbi:ATP-dependent DNA helicase RecG [Nocardioidaceae bacterium]|nr:ATP-dependent DNA helicase RecG [Nocardioidaceae bacterium]
MDSRLDTVAATLARKLRKAYDWSTVGDLLTHYPRTYVRKGDVSDLDHLREGDLIAFVGRVVSATVKSFSNPRGPGLAYRVEAYVEASGGRLGVTFFAKHEGQADWRAKDLLKHETCFVQGKVKQFNNTWQLTHPVVEPLGADGTSEGLDAERERADYPDLRPVYRLAGGIDHSELVRTVKFALDVLDPEPDPLPEPIREELGLVSRDQALRWIHRSEDWPQQRAARARLAFDEALTAQTLLVQRRRARAASAATARPGHPDAGRGGGILAAFDARLPFELTEGQRRVGAQIAEELAAASPMHRMLQGEVGSGKTLVALRAMLQVVDSGGQAVLLAPTEVLAQQHARSLRQMLGDLAEGGRLGAAEAATQLVLLTGSLSAAERRTALLAAASGEAGLVVGTHALLGEQVQLADLGLVVVDEQHRFGVEQRAALGTKSDSTPHTLVMSATPIPRTLAMTVFGDLEVSTLTELPAGRQPIQTVVIETQQGGNGHWLERAWQRIREEVAAGQQAYVVCPRVSAETGPGGAAVETWAPQLASGQLADVRVAPLHGQMPAADKDATMSAFAEGLIDVLVATTVVEVGVDVAAATVMVVLDADMFGVSQLHQLRGRVGRGSQQGLCLLVTGAEGTEETNRSLARIHEVARTEDGFALSRFDLSQRSEGDVLGASQSGRASSLRLLKVLDDEPLIKAARRAAERILDADPHLTEHPVLAAHVRAVEEAQVADYVERS